MKATGMRTLLICNAVLLGLSASLFAGQSGPPEPKTMRCTAKGANVFRGFFSNSSGVDDLEVFMSLDGETYFDIAEAFPRRGRMLWTALSENGGTAIYIPFFAGFDDHQFVLSRPGQVRMRWSVRFVDSKDVPVQLEETVEIAALTDADDRFLSRIAESEFILGLFGDDFFDRQSESSKARMSGPDGRDVRARYTVGGLLVATQLDEPGDFSRGRTIQRTLEIADALWDVSQEVAESGYAPYAAYYSGCGYLLSTMAANKEQAGQICSADAIRNPHYGLAESHFTFAAQRADPYLGAQIAYMQAYLSFVKADWSDAKRRLDGLEQTFTPQEPLKERAQKLAADVDRMQAKQQ